MRTLLREAPPPSIGHFRASARRCVNQKRGELVVGIRLAPQVDIELTPFWLTEGRRRWQAAGIFHGHYKHRQHYETLFPRGDLPAPHYWPRGMKAQPGYREGRREAVSPFNSPFRAVEPGELCVQHGDGLRSGFLGCRGQRDGWGRRRHTGAPGSLVAPVGSAAPRAEQA